MVFVFLQNREAACRRGVAFTTAGDGGFPDLDAAFEKRNGLGGEIDLDGWRAENTIPRPNPVLARFGFGFFAGARGKGDGIILSEVGGRVNRYAIPPARVILGSACTEKSHQQKKTSDPAEVAAQSVRLLYPARGSAGNRCSAHVQRIIHGCGKLRVPCGVSIQ